MAAADLVEGPTFGADWMPCHLEPEQRDHMSLLLKVSWRTHNLQQAASVIKLSPDRYHLQAYDVYFFSISAGSCGNTQIFQFYKELASAVNQFYLSKQRTDQLSLKLFVF